MAAAIRSRYDAALASLPPNAQRHYAQRLYRISGEAMYLPYLQAHGERLLQDLRMQLRLLQVPGHARRSAAEQVAGYPTRTAKQRRRKAMLARWGEIIYAEGLAFDLWQARSYGLLDERWLPGHEHALAYLAGVDCRRFLLDEHVLSVYAAQVANLAWYLHALGVRDLRSDTVTAFRQLYPPARDQALSDTDYRNKIYGMTHFVIAASNYYQQSVSATEFGWVLDEFGANAVQILARAKEDIFTEVGISFLLAGQPAHAVVRQMREAIVRAWDSASGIVPAEDGGIGLAGGEHRNVLAVMLLAWPDRLHAGPDLSRYLAA